MLKRKLLVAALGSFTFVVGTCISTELTYGNPFKASALRIPAGKVFRFRLPFEPATLDWNQGDIPIPVVQNIMRGLYRVDEKGRIVPDLVASGETKNGGKTWVFTLKPDILWNDGKPLQAHHAVESLIRLLNPRTASSYAYFLFDIEGARAFNSGKGTRQGLGIKVLDPQSFEIRLDQPVPFLPAILTHWVTYPIRPDLLEKWPDHWTNPHHLATLGSFQLAEWRPQLRIVLTPNPHTGGATQAAKPWFERAEGWIVADDNTAINLYETDHLDFMTDPGQVAFTHPHLMHRPSPISYFLGAGPGNPLTQSRAGVLALSAALNRKEIPQVLNAPHRPTLEFCPPEVLESLGDTDALTDSRIPMEGSPELAKKYLKEAGFGATPPPPMTLHYFNRPSMKELAEWLQGQWKKNLGLTVQLQGQEPKAYWAALAARPAALFLNSKGTSYPDPDTFFRLFSGKNPQNLGHWQDSDYDQWISKAGSSNEGKERRALYEKGSARLLVEHPALIPLYFRSTGYVVKPYVKGVIINPLTSVDFSQAHYEKGE